MIQTCPTFDNGLAAATPPPEVLLQAVNNIDMAKPAASDNRTRVLVQKVNMAKLPEAAMMA
jgi:hypothetical protein